MNLLLVSQDALLNRLYNRAYLAFSVAVDDVIYIRKKRIPAQIFKGTLCFLPLATIQMHSQSDS